MSKTYGRDLGRRRKILRERKGKTKERTNKREYRGRRENDDELKMNWRALWS